MFEIFNSFGKDKKLSSWLKAIYSNRMSRVKTNGTVSRRFTIQRGSRQGDPLSPLLFAIYIEVPAVAVGQNVDIKGIQSGKETHKLALYANNGITFFLGILFGITKAREFILKPYYNRKKKEG